MYPPGSAPGDSPAKARCKAAAYIAWGIADQEVCGKISDSRRRKACKDTMVVQYSDALLACN